MLTNVKLNPVDAISMFMWDIPQKLETWIYYGSINFENSLPFDLSFDERYREELRSWVADNLDQIKELYKEQIKDPEKKFVICFKTMIKDEQPSSWWWRWHKWWEYIWTQDPQHEYLYNEGPEITKVLVFDIFDVTKHI